MSRDGEGGGDRLRSIYGVRDGDGCSDGVDVDCGWERKRERERVGSLYDTGCALECERGWVGEYDGGLARRACVEFWRSVGPNWYKESSAGVSVINEVRGSIIIDSYIMNVTKVIEAPRGDGPDPVDVWFFQVSGCDRGSASG